jgi:serine/threonine-protein kinase RsbW
VNGAASESVVTLSFPAKADYLLLARLALGGLARRLPVDPDALADLKLAVTEACGNVVRHAYADGDGGPVAVALVVHPDRLEMIVEDRGAGMDRPRADEWEVDQLPEGGMGMAIMRAVVDELDVGAGADGRGTVVHMTKYFAPAA